MSQNDNPTETRTVAGTEPYPWPWHGELRPERLALVVTGTQRTHVEVSPDARAVAERIVTLASAVRRSGGVVCHVRHTSAGGRRRPLLPRVGDEGWAPALRAEPGDLMVEAHGHDGFHGSGLEQQLRARGVELVAVVGMAAEVTVSSTVRSANDRGFECLTLLDAAAPIEELTGERHLHSVTMSGGIFGAIGSTDALVTALLGPTAAGSVPGSSVPGSSVPGTSVPGSSVPGSSVPGSSVPGTAVPGAGPHPSPSRSTPAPPGPSRPSPSPTGSTP